MKTKTKTAVVTLVLCMLTGLLTVHAADRERIVFVPQWMPQSQFAGYYMAQEKGFYEEEGLDVVIDHMSIFSTRTPYQRLQDGECQIAGMQLLQASMLYGTGAPIVNILQTSQNCGLWCISHTPVHQPEDLNGMKIGRWKVGHSEVMQIVQTEHNLDITWVPYLQCVGLYVHHAVDAVLSYSYSEYIQLLLSQGEIPEENILKFSEMGFNYPEDGLYVTASWLKDHRDAAERFARASARGWAYCHAHPDEALEVSMAQVRDANIATSQLHQKLMLKEVLSLQLDSKTGKATFASPDRKIFDDLIEQLIRNGFIDKKVKYDDLVCPFKFEQQ